MGLAEDVRRAKTVIAEKDEQVNSFEMDVRRVESLMQIHKGDKSEVMKVVMLWVELAKRRYDQRAL